MKRLVLLMIAITLQWATTAYAGAGAYLSDDEVTLEGLEKEFPSLVVARLNDEAPSGKLPTVNVLLSFAPNSNVLSEKGTKALSVISEAMNDIWAQFDVLIEAHVGPDVPRKLRDMRSLQRAEKVPAALIRLGVSPRRLRTSGRGDREPVNQAKPTDPKNSRVAFRFKFPNQD